MFSFDGNYFAVINIFLGIIGFIWLLLRTSRRWLEYPSEMRLLLLATLAFIFALLETSAEQILRGEPVTFNSVVIFAVKVFLIFVLFKTRGTLYRTGDRTPHNGDEINPNRKIAASHLEAPGYGEEQPDALPAEQAREK